MPAVFALIRAAHDARVTSLALELVAAARDEIAAERASRDTYAGCTDLTVALIAADRAARAH